MPDRRQGDRRDSSNYQKKITISLNSFIYICIIFTFLICSIFVCSYIHSSSYNKGYTKASSAFYDQNNTKYDTGYDDGYTDGYDYGYADGYADALSQYQDNQDNNYL